MIRLREQQVPDQSRIFDRFRQFSDNGMVIGFYDINGNYQTATQDANGNWIGSDGKPTLSMKKGQFRQRRQFQQMVKQDIKECKYYYEK